MMTTRGILRGLVGALSTFVMLLAMVRASAAPMRYHKEGMARLRLSWTARPERIEVCRALTAAEIAQREEHMRQRVECDGRFATYTLRILSDGSPLRESVVHGAGLRHDRPLYLLRDFDFSSGAHRIQIAFVRREQGNTDTTAIAAKVGVDSDTGLFAGRAQREVVERQRRSRAAIPARLTLDTILTFAPDRVIIVTFDPERRVLQVLGIEHSAR